jgi:predicted ester cyclase
MWKETNMRGKLVGTAIGVLLVLGTAPALSQIAESRIDNEFRPLERLAQLAAKEGTMTVVNPSDIVLNFIETVWNGNNADAADRFLTPNYRDHAYNGGDAKALKAVIRELGAAFPDQRQAIDDLVATDDRVMVRIRLQATHTGTFRSLAPTGRAVDVRVARWFRIEDGRIAEHWALLDTSSLLCQLKPE